MGTPPKPEFIIDIQYLPEDQELGRATERTNIVPATNMLGYNKRWSMESQKNSTYELAVM
jgi:hypothetical protein